MEEPTEHSPFYKLFQWTASIISLPLFLILGVVPFTLAFFLYHFQTKLIYVPDFPKNSKKEIWTPDLFQLDYEELFLPCHHDIDKKDTCHHDVLPDPLAPADSSSSKNTLSSSSFSSTSTTTTSSSSKVSTKVTVTLHAYLIKPPVNPNHDLHHKENGLPPSFHVFTQNKHRHALFTPPSYSKELTILFFHGNAGNIGHRLPIVKELVRSLNCNVFMLSYRGYGKSEGTPNEFGLKLDAQAALNYLTSHPVLKSIPIYVFGQSIGGAVAVHLVANNPSKVAGLILENTFLSLPKLIPSVLPWLSPFRFLCHQVWDNESLISKFDLPILFLSSKRDELIPPSHMAKLYETSRSQHREFVTFDFGTHNDAPQQPGYYEAIQQFVHATQKRVCNTSHARSKKLN